MRKRFRGFTLIEVSLFLVVSGGLIVAVIAGTTAALERQHYNDAVQSFADFLRGVYSEVSNPQSVGKGNSNQAIYGKLITFGESLNRNGESNSNNAIFVYDVLGDVSGTLGGSTVIGTLDKLGVTVIRCDENSKCSAAGIDETYNMQWGTVLENVDANLFTGSILIVRSPSSGTIYTYASPQIINVNETIKNINSQTGTADGLLKLDSFDDKQKNDVNFCVNNQSRTQSPRRNVRIQAGARGASDVVLVDQDSEDNQCIK